MVPFVLVTRIRVGASWGVPRSVCTVGGGVHPRPWIRTAGCLFRKLVNRVVVVREMKSSSLFIPTTTHAFSGPFYGHPVLSIGESVVPRRVWVSLVELPEFLQTAY